MLLDNIIPLAYNKIGLQSIIGVRIKKTYSLIYSECKIRNNPLKTHVPIYENCFFFHTLGKKTRFLSSAHFYRTRLINFFVYNTDHATSMDL